MVNKEASIIGHLRKFGEYLRRENTYHLLFLGGLVLLQPYLDHDVFDTVGPDVDDSTTLDAVLSMFKGILFASILFGMAYKGIKSIARVSLVLLMVLIVQMLLEVATLFSFLALRNNVFATYTLDYGYDLYQSYSLITVSIMLVQYVSKNISEGCEGFAINGVSGIINLFALLSSYLGRTVMMRYLRDKDFSDESFTLASVSALSYSLMLLITSFLIFKISGRFNKEALKLRRESL